MSNTDSKFDMIWVNGQLPDPKTATVENMVEELWITYAEELYVPESINCLGINNNSELFKRP